MTKYVELVIVADNREVRALSNFSVQLVKNRNREKKILSKLSLALINLIFYEPLKALETTR